MSTLKFSHLRQLAVFATVIETQSFAAAARHLHSSRSRVSEQVSQLESALGVRLLQRSTRQLLVTHEGHEVYEQARQLPGMLNSIESIVTRAEAQGRVVITMNHDIAHKFVLPVLDEFQKQYPLINLDLKLDDEVSDLIADQIDLGIRIGFPNDNSLIGRVMHEECMGVFASPEFVERFGMPKTVKQLEQLRWILLPQIEYENVIRLRSKKGTVELRPDNFHRCNSPHLIQSMVEASLGVATLLPSTVKSELETKGVIQLMPSLKTEPLVISLVYPSRQHVPQRTRVLIDFLLDENLFDRS